MYLALSFAIGLLIGYSVTVFHVNKMIKLLDEIEVKYTRLLAIMCEWQKKI